MKNTLTPPPSSLFYKLHTFNKLQSFFPSNLTRRYTRALARAPLCAPRITPAHYPGGAMVARRGSRLAPYRHYAPSTLARSGSPPNNFPSFFTGFSIP